MSNYNSNDNRADSNGSDHFDPAVTEAEQEFAYLEEKKPINRNMVVLLLIAVVGASMIYLMYLRGRFNADQQTPEQLQAAEAVNTFIKEGAGSIKQMEEQLARTERQVAVFQQDSSGQIALTDLKTNPFGFIASTPKTSVQAPAQIITPADPTDAVRLAVSKTKIQMILYSANNSSVTINNWVYKAGDRIVLDNIPFTVKSISAKDVVLSNQAGEFVLTAPGSQGL